MTGSASNSNPALPLLSSENKRGKLSGTQTIEIQRLNDRNRGLGLDRTTGKSEFSGACSPGTGR